jgi:hypothetical protein
MMSINTTVFRDMAAMLRQRAGWNVERISFVKGDWFRGRDRVQINGTQWASRPDWLLHGHEKWWDGRIFDYKVGFVADGFVPLPRGKLGDTDETLWEVWNKGRDPWALKYTLPLFNQVSGEQAIWQTDTIGGKDCLAALLQAFADRVDMHPADNAILPVVELGSSSYHHESRGKINTPTLDLISWIVPPNIPRPSLPQAPLPKPESQQVIEGPRTSLAKDFDDSIPFAPEWR